MRIPPLVQAIVWMAAARTCVRAQDITVAVLNYAAVPHLEMAGAIRTARLAYRSAGIDSAWIVCSLDTGDQICSQPLPADGRYLELAVMPHRAKTLDTRLTHGEPAGLALTGVEFLRPRAYAFYSATKDAADHTVRPLDVVLGCVLVHESAHLLGLGHQPSGLMRAQVDAHDLDAAVAGRSFTASEAERLRSGVMHFEAGGRRTMACGAGAPAGIIGSCWRPRIEE
jgi:hypothetical protein